MSGAARSRRAMTRRSAGLAHMRVPQSSAGDRARSALHLYIALIDFDAIGTTRTAFMTRLRKAGVGSSGSLHSGLPASVLCAALWRRSGGVSRGRAVLSRLSLAADLSRHDRRGCRARRDDGARKPWARHDGPVPHRARYGAVRHALRRVEPRRANRTSARWRRSWSVPSRRASDTSIPRRPMAMPKSCLAGICRPATACASSPRRRPCRTSASSARHKQQWLDALALSLDRLKVSAVYGLLVHQTGDLDKPGWQYLVEALQEAQSARPRFSHRRVGL